MLEKAGSSRDEVREVVRKKMKVKASEVSDMQLKGLFCKLDSDDGKDNSVLVEFGRMKRMGPQALKEGADEARRMKLKAKAKRKIEADKKAGSSRRASRARAPGYAGGAR